MKIEMILQRNNQLKIITLLTQILVKQTESLLIIQEKYQNKFLAKFVNKKPKIVKNTLGTKSKKNLSRDKSIKANNMSKERKIISATKTLNKRKPSHHVRNPSLHERIPSHHVRKPSLNKNDLKGITQLADDFWNNIDKEKKMKKAVKPRAGTPQMKNPVFSTKIKINTIRRGSNNRFQNKYFHEKFKESISKRSAKSRQNSVTYMSKSKREISNPRNKVGGKTIINKKVKKISKSPKDGYFYSSMHNKLPLNDKIDKNSKAQQHKFEQDDKQYLIDNQLLPSEEQNIDSTLQLTLDDKETFNIHPKDEEGLLEGSELKANINSQARYISPKKLDLDEIFNNQNIQTPTPECKVDPSRFEGICNSFKNQLAFEEDKKQADTNLSATLSNKEAPDSKAKLNTLINNQDEKNEHKEEKKTSIERLSPSKIIKACKKTNSSKNLINSSDFKHFTNLKSSFDEKNRSICYYDTSKSRNKNIERGSHEWISKSQTGDTECAINNKRKQKKDLQTISTKIVVSSLPTNDFKDYDTLNLKIQHTVDTIGGSNDDEIKHINYLNSSKLKQIESSVIINKNAMINEIKNLNRFNVKLNMGKEIGDIDSVNYNSAQSSSRHRKAKLDMNTEIEEHIALKDANKLLAVQANKYNKKLRNKINKQIEK